MLTLFIVLLTSVHLSAEEVSESDFFTPPVNMGETCNLVADYSVNNRDKRDDSARLLQAIDDISSLKSGGIIRIPTGRYYFKKILLKSNVTLSIDKNAVLYPYNMDNSDYMFGMGVEFPVENVAIIGDPERFLIDLTEDDNTFMKDDKLVKKAYHPFRIRGGTMK